MEPTENLTLADSLHLEPARVLEECRCRASIGRSYYAAFGHACVLLDDANFTITSNANAHKEVVEYLKASTDPSVVALAAMLEELRRIRNSADYDVGKRTVRLGPFNPSRSQYVLKKAQRIIEKLSAKAMDDQTLQIPRKP